jgi:hypothetical protein
MPVVYHGTSRAFAKTIAANPGAIDVHKGRGEFGRGFYTQDSISNASRRGYLLYGKGKAAVVALTIDDSAYHALRFMRLTINSTQKLNAKLRRQKATRTYVTVHDVIIGPLVNQPKITQQKFQSVAAKDLLNGSSTQRSVRP